MAQADQHGVLPLVYQALERHARGLVPSDVSAELRRRFEANALHNLVLTGELARLIQLLGAQGIKAMAFKGPVLAASAYGDLALRQFVDLDVLVNKTDVRAAALALLREGYVERTAFSRSRRLSNVLRSHHQLGFLRDDPRVIVEIQWHLTPHYFAFAPNLDALWRRERQVTVAGSPLPSLGPEDHLLFLYVHGAKHCWERLTWVSDLAHHISSNPGLDWPAIAAQAEALGTRRMLRLGLDLIDVLVSPRVTQPAQACVPLDPIASRMARHVAQRMHAGQGGPRGIIATSRFHLRARERLRDRARYVIRRSANASLLNKRGG